MRYRILSYVLIGCSLLISMLGGRLNPAEASWRPIRVTTQQFDNGLMIWRSDNADIWVLTSTSIAYKFTAAFYNQLSDNTVVSVPAGRPRPLFGFGRIWTNLPAMRTALGYAILPEIGFNANISAYTTAAGEVVEFPQLNGKVLVAYQTPAGYRWRYGGEQDQSTTIATQVAFQTFDNGYMLWRADTQDVLVFSGKMAGQMSFYPLSLYGAWPDNQVRDIPPDGHVKPINAFGRVWSRLWLENQRYLGWPVAPEQGYAATIIEAYPVKPRDSFISGIQISLPHGPTITISRGYSYANWDIR